MNKIQLVKELVEINIEVMEYDDLVALAKAKLAEDFAKMSKAELEDQYEYVAG